MYRMLVTYTDFRDQEATDELFFHLTKAEVIDLEIGTRKGEGSLSASLQRIIDTKDGEEMYRTFKHVLTVSHGILSDDGKRHLKNERTREDFLSSAAFSALIERMLEDTDFAIEFVLNILPRGLQEEAQKLAGIEPTTPLAVVKDPEQITRQDLIELSTEEIPEVSRRIARGEVVVVDGPTEEVSQPAK